MSGSGENNGPVVWIVNHYGGSPGEVRSERSWRIARSLAANGFRTWSLSASEHHIRTQAVAGEDVGRPVPDESGYEQVAVATRAYEGNGLSRLLNMCDFYRGLKRMLAEGVVPAPDLVIASSPHPFTYLFALFARRKAKSRVILEERDIWPLSLIELAGTPKWHPVVWLFGWMAGKGYRNCDALVSLLPDSEKFLQSKGLAAGKFHCIPNGVGASDRSADSAELPGSLDKWIQQSRSEGKLTVVYTGAMGPPNALDQLLDLSKVGEVEKPYRILCIGEGVERESLTERAGKLDSGFVTFAGPVSRSEARALIEAADVCFISLRPSSIFELGVSPNKLFEYMSAGKPVIFSVNSSNNPVAEAGSGFTVTPYDGTQLDEVLCELSAMAPEERSAMGAKGVEYVQQHHHWDTLGKRYADLCREVLESGAA